MDYFSGEMQELALKKYKQKIINAALCNLKVNITFEQYCEKMVHAKITPEMISRSGYHLARLGDTGDYNLDNCRFITAHENILERDSRYPRSQKQSEHSKDLGTRNLRDRIDLAAAGRQSLLVQRQKKRIDIDLRRLNLVINTVKSSLNLNTWGWTGTVATKFKVSHTEVRRAFTQFYNGPTYKRSSPVASTKLSAR